MSTNVTRLSQHIRAPRSDVYRALIDAQAVAAWMVPDNMTSYVHIFDAHEGGQFRISLTYTTPGEVGKTSAHTDTYRGYFARLIPNELVVQVMEFETDDPAMRGEMTVTFTLTGAGEDMYLHAIHDNVPRGIAPADNEIGWRMALAKLARLVEAGHSL